jgi:hypothetical protein
MSLGVPEEIYPGALERHGRELLDLAYFLDYVSIGFRYRAQRNATLIADLFARGSAR